jgi:8-amino-7-oxononanoate synthase
VLDFTSSLYLGLGHPSGALRPWTELTTGRPAALGEPGGAQAVAARLAALLGCERATLAPSTLHLFWDLFGMLGRCRAAIYLDARTYPVAGWGVERAAAHGIPVRVFGHHDSSDLRRHLRRDVGGERIPLVVADGLCPACGRAAPLADYLAAVRARGGQLLIDDTQALGVRGEAPGPDAPYGRGGGGSLRWGGIGGPDVLVVSSLAKGFGAPLAALAGSDGAIGRFEERSETRVYNSPPSAAAIRAAECALLINRQHGDALRMRLWHLVRHFRAHLEAAGLAATGGSFPVQTIVPSPEQDVRQQHQCLLDRGIRMVLRRDHDGTGARISLLITARHDPTQLTRAVAALASGLSSPTAARWQWR